LSICLNSVGLLKLHQRFQWPHHTQHEEGRYEGHHAVSDENRRVDALPEN
jgi:hypothetical protein